MKARADGLTDSYVSESEFWEQYARIQPVKDTSKDTSASAKNSMNKYFKTKTELARFVKDLPDSLLSDLPLTITIKQGKYEGLYVSIVTGTSSADTAKDVS